MFRVLLRSKKLLMEVGERGDRGFRIDCPGVMSEPEEAEDLSSTEDLSPAVRI